MNQNPISFHNQVCLVTGASRGIGQGIALELAKYGAKVAINYRENLEAARKTADQIRDLGSEALIVQADVSDQTAIQRMMETTHAHFGRLDLLVHNVGRFTLQTISETTIEEWHALMSTNLHSAFYCIKSALPIMHRQGRGHFIFIGSVKADSLRARQNAGAYGITKTGIVLLAKTLAREEGSQGIRANVINPGAIEGGWATDARRDMLIEQVPLHRLGTRLDIAGAVLYLHSDLGAYCNGCVINIDGGLWI